MVQGETNPFHRPGGVGNTVMSQVCKWLRTNDVSVTIAGLSIFLIREDRKAAKQSRR
jgi:hypothetical protein